jgi:predicted TIM-barrel fold metal-dependent hydrolase
VTTTTTSREPWIDADAHIYEATAIWERLPAEYRARVTVTPMTDDPVLSRTTIGCDTAIDGKGIPIWPEAKRSSRVERYVHDFKAKYKISSGSDPKQYLADMDQEGLERVVIYPTLFLWTMWMPDMEPKFAAAICRAYNDWVHEFIAADRNRMFAVAALPMQDVELAIAEVKRCSKLGFVGVFLRPNPMNGRTIGDPAHHPLFALLEEHRLSVGIHEGQLSYMPTLGADRTQASWATHCMAHPFEQMAAMVSLVEHDAMQKFPGLNFLFLEGGTALWLPFWLNRLDAERKYYRMKDRSSLSPSELFTRQGFATCEVDDPYLPQTLSCISDRKLLMSTDYPHLESPYPNSVTEFNQQKISAESRLRIGQLNALDAYPLLPR